MKRGDDARAVLTKEAQSKVVMRRLPPHLTSEQLLEQISPLPDHDYYYFVPADLSLRPHAFCRAYINFSSSEGVLEFRDRFDGYVFINEKGQEFPAVVEFAAFQKIPKKRVRKRDAKCGTIEEDEDFARFLESCREQSDEAGAKNPEQLLEEVEARTREMGTNKSTPLLEYIKNKMLEKQRAREERWAERRRVDSRRSVAAGGGGGGGAISGHDPRRRYRGAAMPAAADDGGGPADDAGAGGGGGVAGGVSRRVRPETRPRRTERQREREGPVHKGPHGGTQGGAPVMTVKLLQKRGPTDPSEAKTATPPAPPPPSPPPSAPAPQVTGTASPAPGPPADAEGREVARAEVREAAGWPRERTRPRGWEESRRKRAERAQPGGRDERGEDGGGGGGGRFLSNRGGERDGAKEAAKDRDGGGGGGGRDGGGGGGRDGGGGREGPSRDAARPTRDSGGGVRSVRPSPLPPGRPAPHHQHHQHHNQQQQQQREPRSDAGADQGRLRATNAAAGRRPPREVEGRSRGERGESEGRAGDGRSPDRDGERERRKEEARARRLRNKERPSIQLYTPGGGRRQQRPDVSQPGQEKDGPAT